VNARERPPFGKWRKLVDQRQRISLPKFFRGHLCPHKREGNDAAGNAALPGCRRDVVTRGFCIVGFAGGPSRRCQTILGTAQIVFRSRPESRTHDRPRLMPPRLHKRCPKRVLDVWTDISRMAGAFGAMSHPVGALRNKNRHMTDCACSKAAELPPRRGCRLHHSPAGPQWFGQPTLPDHSTATQLRFPPALAALP